ncbi:MAG: UDP-N-acetylglucosamine 2-epimerase (non-hydrolyzing) [Cellvibrionaceae bacterium]
MKLIDIIAGARPNFVKIAPIVEAIEKEQKNGFLVEYRLIHTGQHYDAAMSGSFFEQLGIPEPHINLEVGSGTQAEQTGAIMTGYESLLANKKSDLCIVVGDVNSTMACSIVARKMGVKVAHVEAGIRSNDWAMPEEINRVVTDSITNWFFTTSRAAGLNLKKAGVEDERIFFVGNTMIDTLLKQRENFRAPTFWGSLNLQKKEYVVLTLHRPSNVDGENKLIELLQLINDAVKTVPVVFPVHPRTSNMLKTSGQHFKNIHFVDPQAYLEFNYLVEHSKGVVTDSGGITEETTVMGIPCITLRENTERPETVEIGTNELAGTDHKIIKEKLEKLLSGSWKKGAVPELWDGSTGERVLKIIKDILK